MLSVSKSKIEVVQTGCQRDFSCLIPSNLPVILSYSEMFSRIISSQFIRHGFSLPLVLFS